MAEITPIQVNSSGAVMFEKSEAPPMVKQVVKIGANLCKSGDQSCSDELVLSLPLKTGRKKSYFTKPPTPQDLRYLENPKGV